MDQRPKIAQALKNLPTWISLNNQRLLIDEFDDEDVELYLLGTSKGYIAVRLMQDASGLKFTRLDKHSRPRWIGKRKILAKIKEVKTR